MENAHALSAADAARAIRDGGLTSVDLVKSCLDRIDAFEPKVRAWTHLDPDFALEQAEAADKVRFDGLPMGPLHGVPVGIKDIFDTVDFPTELGSPIHAGRRTMHDAAAVSQLKQAGAVIMGKTVTTEFAVYAPGKTRNPHDENRTPGGSSSGSAAAVAAFMVPLALGSQTNGSTIRPASYCGVVGYKPSFGLISRTGALKQSTPLDQVGVFARSARDAALMAEAMMAYDDRDGAMIAAASPALSAVVGQDPAMPPKVAFLKSPVWDQAERGTREAFAELTEVLGDRCAEIEIADVYGEVFELHRMIMEADLAKNFAYDFDRAADQFSPQLSEMIARGQKVTAVEYNIARERQAALRQGLDKTLAEFDAIITLATSGEAPEGLSATGSPVFCTLWTYTGLPAVTLPLMTGEAGMPLGVQLIGRMRDDGRLLRTAHWLTHFVGASSDEAAA